MPFLEVRFPEKISFHAIGGPGFLTNVVIVNSGQEYRNQVWAKQRAAYEVSHAARLPAQYKPLQAFFRAASGRQNGFRFKDWSDFEVSSSEGRFRKIDSTHYQLTKRYISGLATFVGTSTTSLTIGTGTRTFTTQTGLSFVAGLTVRANRAADYPTYMEGVVASYSGSTLVLTIATVVGSGTFTDWDLALSGATYYREITKPTATPSATIVGGSTPSVATTTGIVSFASGTPTSWHGEFDVPCRFDTDQMKGEILDKSRGELIIGWSSIPIIEIRP